MRGAAGYATGSYQRASAFLLISVRTPPTLRVEDSQSTRVVLSVVWLVLGGLNRCSQCCPSRSAAYTATALSGKRSDMRLPRVAQAKLPTPNSVGRRRQGQRSALTSSKNGVRQLSSVDSRYRRVRNRVRFDSAIRVRDSEE